MLISCPKCNAVYDISDKHITSKGKKFKCAECDKIWTVYPQDIQPIEPDNVIKSQKIIPQNNDDVAAMYNRLSHETDKLFIESKSNENQSIYAKLYRKLQVIFTPVYVIFCLLALFIVLSIMIAYYNRYEISGIAPKMEGFYHKFALESVYKGKNIVFQNIEMKRINVNDKEILEITGSLHNKGKFISHLLPLKAIIKDNKGNIEQKINLPLSVTKLEPQFSTLFHAEIPLISGGEKTITLQFTD